MMLQTYEASPEPNGELRFLDTATSARVERCRVLVTFLPPNDPAPTVEIRRGDERNGDWMTFLGVLKDSPRFEADPLAIQQQMRGEWN
jgi:hypothetical protein